MSFNRNPFSAYALTVSRGARKEKSKCVFLQPFYSPFTALLVRPVLPVSCPYVAPFFLPALQASDNRREAMPAGGTKLQLVGELGGQGRFRARVRGVGVAEPPSRLADKPGERIGRRIKFFLEFKNIGGGYPVATGLLGSSAAPSRSTRRRIRHNRGHFGVNHSIKCLLFAR